MTIVVAAVVPLGNLTRVGALLMWLIIRVRLPLRAKVATRMLIIQKESLGLSHSNTNVSYTVIQPDGDFQT